MSDTTTNISLITDMTDTLESDFIYDTPAVSKVLGVQESTLRKYCSLMQKHYYEFNKNAVGHRVFYKKDIEVLKKIVELKNKGLTLNESVKTVLSSDIDDIAVVESVIDQGYTKLLEEFEEFKEQQQQFNEQLLEIIQHQQEYIKKGIEERDNKLTFALKESLEVRRQLAAVEEAKEEDARVVKKRWWRKFI